MGVSAPPRARTAWASHGMCRRASVGQPRASRKDASATMGPTLQRDPGSHHATMVAAASRVTVRVPILLGTCRVARVSRRRPRPWPLRRRVGGVDVITLPWSHMCTPHEAGAACAGRLSRARGTESVPLHAATASAMRCAVAHAPCGLMHAATGCARALTGRTVVGHAGPVCPGLQTLPLRAAFAPTGAFGSACFVVHARRRWRVKRVGAGAASQHGPH